MEKNETPKNLALLTADEVTLSILEVDAEGVRIKLWPDVNAVRAHLEECCERMPGGLAGYSVRHYVCGRYLYCAVALADITKDAPCPTTYRVSSDAPTNEADGSFLAAAAAWSIGAGVLNLPPLRIPASKVHIVPQLRNVKGGRLEELKNLKLVLAAAIDGYSDPKALPQLAKQYRETVREIEEIEGAANSEDEICEILGERAADGKSGAVRKSRT